MRDVNHVFRLVMFGRQELNIEHNRTEISCMEVDRETLRPYTKFIIEHSEYLLELNLEHSR